MQITITIDPTKDGQRELLLARTILDAFAGNGQPVAPSTAVVAAPPTVPANPPATLPPPPAPSTNAPPAVPVAAAGTPPPPPPAAPSAPANGAARDTKGIPWDERIHSAEKGTNKDGTWRKRRNVDDVTYGQVLAEITSPAAPGNLPPNPLVPPPPAAPASAGTFGIPPPAAAPPPPPAPADPARFTELMNQLMPHIRSEKYPQGTLEQSDIVNTAAQFGLVDASGIGKVSLLAEPGYADKIDPIAHALIAIINQRMATQG